MCLGMVQQWTVMSGDGSGMWWVRVQVCVRACVEGVSVLQGCGCDHVHIVVRLGHKRAPRSRVDPIYRFSLEDYVGIPLSDRVHSCE
jgi:hypothetical protein